MWLVNLDQPSPPGPIMPSALFHCLFLSPAATCRLSLSRPQRKPRPSAHHNVDRMVTNTAMGCLVHDCVVLSWQPRSAADVADVPA